MLIKHNNKFFYISLLLSFLLLLIGISDIFTDSISPMSLFLMAIGGNSIAVFAVLFPLLACLPILLEFAEEFDSGFIWYRLQKQSYLKLYLASYGTYILKGGLSLAIPSFLMALLTLLKNNSYINKELCLDIMFLPELAAAHPFVYMCILTINIFFCGIVCSSLSIGLYILFHNKYIAFIIPFVYFLFSGIVLFRINPQLSLTWLYSIYISGLPNINIRLTHAWILIIIGFVFYLLGIRRLKKNV